MENENKDDEISLIDLFAVLLRYRKLIIGIMMVSILVCAANFLFILRNRTAEPDSRSISTTKAVITLTPGVDFFFGDKYISDFFASPELIMNVFNNTKGQMLTLEKIIEEGYVPSPAGAEVSNIINYESNNKKIVLTETVTTKTVTIQYTDAGEDSGTDQRFIEALCRGANRAINEYIQNAAENYMLSYENLISAGSITGMGQSSPIEAGAYYFLAQDITKQAADVIYFVAAPYSYSEKPESGNRLLMTSVIIIAGAFFLAVFLSFFLNMIRNVKQDTEAMSKINDALKKPQKGEK